MDTFKKCLLMALLFSVLTVLYVNQFFILEKNVSIGKSMYPAIKDGDVTWNLKILNGDLTGKIVNYDHEDMVIAHRIVEDNGDYVVAKGDNNAVNDPWEIQRSQLRSQVIAILPWWGRYIDIAMFTVIGIGGIIYVWKMED